MQRDEQAYFEDIARACEEILSYTANHDLASFLADGRTRRAVERCLEIVGEGLAHLRRKDIGLVNGIPGFRKIIGLRNLLIHEYGRVDDALLWHSVIEELPGFIVAAQSKLMSAENE